MKRSMDLMERMSRLAHENTTVVMSSKEALEMLGVAIPVMRRAIANEAVPNPPGQDEINDESNKEGKFAREALLEMRVVNDKLMARVAELEADIPDAAKDSAEEYTKPEDAAETADLVSGGDDDAQDPLAQVVEDPPGDDNPIEANPHPDDGADAGF